MMHLCVMLTEFSIAFLSIFHHYHLGLESILKSGTLIAYISWISCSQNTFVVSWPLLSAPLSLRTSRSCSGISTPRNGCSSRKNSVSPSLPSFWAGKYHGFHSYVCSSAGKASHCSNQPSSTEVINPRIYLNRARQYLSVSMILFHCLGNIIFTMATWPAETPSPYRTPLQNKAQKKWSYKEVVLLILL